MLIGARALAWRRSAGAPATGRRRRHHDPKDELLLLVPRPARAPSAARSRPSSISAAPWTMRWIWSRIGDRATAALEKWRREVGARLRGATPETPQGVALQPFVEPFHLPRAQFDALVDGVAMDATPRRYPDVRGARAVLPSRGVGGRPDVRGDLRLPRAARAGLRARSGRRAAAHEHPARRRRGLPPRPRLPAAGRISRGSAAPRTTSGRKSKAPAAACSRRRFARCWSIRPRARASSSRARSRALPKDDARRFVAAEIMRAIYFDLLRRIEDARLRRVHVASFACRGRARRGWRSASGGRADER